MGIYEYYKTKKVYIKDIYSKLENTIVIYYKKQKVASCKKGDILRGGWNNDLVVYMSTFPDEGISTIYLEPSNTYLKRKVI